MLSGFFGMVLRLVANAIAMRVAQNVVDRITGNAGTRLTNFLFGLLVAALGLIGIRLKR